jgi:hypothetical protein
VAGTSGFLPYSKPGLAKPSGETAHRVADDGGFGDAEPVHQRGQHLHAARIGVVGGRVGAGQAEAGQIVADNAELVGQRVGPFIPRLQAGAEAVQQDHRRRIARPGVAHMQPDAGDIQVVGRRDVVFRLQRGARLVGRVEKESCPHQHSQQDDDDDQHGEFHAGLSVTTFSRHPRRRPRSHDFPL